MQLNRRSHPQPSRSQTLWSAINYVLYIGVIVCVISIIPHSLGLEIMQFDDIVTKKVGEDKGQELYQGRYEYLSKFKKEEKAANEGQINATNLPPLQAVGQASEQKEDYLQTKDMQLYIADKAVEYQVIGDMKLSHYQQLLEKKQSLEELNETLGKIKKMREVFNKKLLAN